MKKALREQLTRWCAIPITILLQSLMKSRIFLKKLYCYCCQEMILKNPEVDIFNFLVRWHAYQTEELGNTLQLVPQLFRHIRYALINPRLLLAKVIDCVHVDKQLLAEALDCLYNKPLQNKSDECKCCECSSLKTGDVIRTPRVIVKASDIWKCHNNTNSVQW